MISDAHAPISKGVIDASCIPRDGANALEDDAYLERAHCHMPDTTNCWGEQGPWYTFAEPRPEVPLDFNKHKRASNSRYWRMR
jgi:hypothetical protein